jgi:hypothetical protein
VTDEFGFQPKTPVFDLTSIFGGENGGLPELIEGPERWSLIMNRPTTSYYWGGYVCLPNEGPLWRTGE